MLKGIFIIVLFGLLVSCKTSKNAELKTAATPSFAVDSRKDVLFDSSRNRKIPIVIYQPKTSLVLPRYLTFFVHVQFLYIFTLDRLILVFSIDASFHCYKKKLLPRQKY